MFHTAFLRIWYEKKKSPSSLGFTHLSTVRFSIGNLQLLIRESVLHMVDLQFLVFFMCYFTQRITNLLLQSSACKPCWPTNHLDALANQSMPLRDVDRNFLRLLTRKFTSTSWWFQPVFEYVSHWIISPGRDKNETSLKPPTRKWWPWQPTRNNHRLSDHLLLTFRTLTLQDPNKHLLRFQLCLGGRSWWWQEQ